MERDIESKRLQDVAHRKESKRVAALYPIKWQARNSLGHVGLCTTPDSATTIEPVCESSNAHLPSSDWNSTCALRELLSSISPSMADPAETLPDEFVPQTSACLTDSAECTFSLVCTDHNQRQETPNLDVVKEQAIVIEQQLRIANIVANRNKRRDHPSFLELPSPALSLQQRNHKRHKILCSLATRS
jgi:hypothetical protein